MEKFGKPNFDFSQSTSCANECDNHSSQTLNVKLSLGFRAFSSTDYFLAESSDMSDTMSQSHQLINQTSGKVEYYTPPNIIEAARHTLCLIDLDPASCEAANRIVKATRYFTKADDGLLQVWRGRVWMNHPFGKGQNKLWIDKLVRAFDSGSVTAACCITWACTSEKWFQPLLRFPQCFLFPRTNYLLEDGSVLRGSTKGSVVTYLGPDVERFAEAFSKLGSIKIEFHP